MAPDIPEYYRHLAEPDPEDGSGKEQQENAKKPEPQRGMPIPERQSPRPGAAPWPGTPQPGNRAESHLPVLPVKPFTGETRLTSLN